MSEPPASVEDRIVLAAIDCVEKYGISGATNRRIAFMANVNSAAINYYFRSKETLLRRCMEITLKNAFDLAEVPPMPGASPEQRCLAVMQDLVAGGFRYPGLTRAHFFDLLAEGKRDALLVKHVRRFVDDLAADLHGRGCALPMEELKLALSQIVSAVFLVILAPGLFDGQESGQPDDPAAWSNYLARLVNKLLV